MAEGIRCHETGARRAAYIIAWVACAEALTARLSSMSHGHGGLAKELEAYRNDPRDADLIRMGQQYGYLSEVEAETLRTIMKHRHQYAHPNSISPRAFEVEFAIEYATRTVLARQAKTTAKLAKQLAERIATDPEVIYSGVAPAKAWVDENADEIAPEAHSAFLISLATCEISSTNADAELLRQRRRTIIADLLERWRPDFTESRWKLREILDGSQWLDFACAVTTVDHWHLIPNNLQPKLVQRVIREANPQERSRPPWSGLAEVARDPRTGNQEIRDALVGWANVVDLRVLKVDPWQPMLLEFTSSRLRTALTSPSWGSDGDRVEADRKTAAELLSWLRIAELNRLDTEEQQQLARSLMSAALTHASEEALTAAQRQVRFHDKSSLPFHETLKQILEDPERFKKDEEPPF